MPNVASELARVESNSGLLPCVGSELGASGLSRSQAKGTTMLSKHKVGTPMSGFLAVTRRFVLAFLLIGLAAIAIGLAAIAIGLAANAYAELGSPVLSPLTMLSPNAMACLRSRWAPGSAPSCWPVAACCCWPTVSAGRRSRSPDLRFSGRRSCVEREWVGSQDGAKIGIATGGEIVHCIVSPPMIEPFERGPG